MAGFWDDLGRGLQDAGAILSPTVYQSQEQERQLMMKQRIQQQQMQQQLMATSLIAGIQSGTTDPNNPQVQQAMKGLGLGNMAGLIGPSLEAQQKLAYIKSPPRMEAPQQPGAQPAFGPANQQLQGLLQWANKPENRMAAGSPQFKIDLTMAQQAATLEREQANLKRLADKDAQAAPTVRNNVPVDGKPGFEQDLQWDRDTRQWKPLGAPRPIFKPPTVNVNVNSPEAQKDIDETKIGQILAGEPRAQIVFGLGKEAGQKWDRWSSMASKRYANEHGISVSEAANQIATNQMEYKARGASLVQLSKDLTSIRPFKGMLDKNIDIAVGLADKGISTHSALANKSINYLKERSGDYPDMSEYLAQMRFVQTEAARVLANPRLVGVLSDSARQEMEQVINGTMPINSTKRVLARIKADGNNRINEMYKERDRLLSRGESTEQPEQKTTPKIVDFKDLK